ncbi:hypothetical protein EST38_g2426 [Candolleomyces aberdarensis]|uniref:Uncharacterized protein n=1 Tax=Candolleomyces aberdarensis TaxID=2316362 RepID=A0A4Q2DVM6_9AGAR|nr:hypothetical protein EST38_g2426 [Candolleomyces aberdarensis]
MDFRQAPRVAPAVATRRQEAFTRMWQAAVAENPGLSEEVVLKAYIRKAYTAAMEQYNATSEVFTGPYLTEQDIIRIARQTNNPNLRPLILKSTSMVGPAHFQNGQDGFAFINPRAADFFNTTKSHQINPAVTWNDSRFNKLDYFRKNTFLVFVEIGGPSLTPGYAKFKYIGTFYVRTYGPGITLDRYANAENKVNDDVSVFRPYDL